jgi:hypothetical protein
MTNSPTALNQSKLLNYFKQIMIKIVYVYMRTSPPRRDLAIIHPRSRLVGLEFSHINAVEWAGPSNRAE